MKKIIWISSFILIILILIMVLYISSLKNEICSNSQVPNNQNENINIYENSDKYVDSIIGSMSLEEKVGQLFICAYRKDSNNSNMYELNDDAKTMITKYNLGGFILFSENMKNIDQTRKFIIDINNTNLQIPMFISVDVEGGVVDRLAKSSLTSALPYISELGLTKDETLSYEYAKIIGRRLKYLGFNLDFAPVCDLDNSDSIKYRSFGKDPYIVSKMISGYIKGLNEYNISSTLKHFPGLGSSEGDTHNQIVTSNITLSELENSDFIPFKIGIKSGTNIIMINHVVYNNLSKNIIPASLNKDIYELLRNNLNFDGIIVTDGLEMGAITKQNISTSPSYAAFLAGADILLLPQDIDYSYNEILNAVRSGQISTQRLDDSVKRIIKHKYISKFFKKESSIISNFNDKNDYKIIDKITKK
ncbi:MAG: glycoside hydrolase family 3 protein [Clostridia bacterium]|nr:glycoside hydrolase family 3 protein [Clostridia bacterium]